MDRLTVNLYNINTERQQLINAVQLQENALKFYIGMPIETQIIIPQTEFEVTPQALSEAPNTATRTEYLALEKQERAFDISEKISNSRLLPNIICFGKL